MLKNLKYYGIFLILSLFYFDLVNLYFTSTTAPDFKPYSNYIDFFYGNRDITGRENGLIYYYLVTYLFSFFTDFISPYRFEHLISNSVQLVNFFLLLFGLYGLNKLLIIKKFKSKDNFFVLLLVLISPISLKLLVTMKPEVFAFSLITWILLILEIALEKQDLKYLYFLIFPLLNILNTKGTIIASVFLILLYYFVKNFSFLITSIHFKLSCFIFLILYIPLSLENFNANGYHIFDHQPSLYETFDNSSVPLSFLFNINFTELITTPFKDNHANSLIGILLLDTFGDYFKWYQNNSLSLFSILEVNFKQIWFLTHWRELFTILFSFLFFLFSIIFSIKNKDYKKYFLIYLFGLIPLIIHTYGNQVLYDLGDSELYKTHYFSYLLLISLAFIVSQLLKQEYFNKYLFSLIFITTLAFLYGFPKLQNDEISQYINLKNNTAVFCSLNNTLIKNIDSDCFKKEQLICFDDPLIDDVRFVEYKDALLEAKSKSIYPLELINKEGSKIYVENENECITHVTNKYIVNSDFDSIVNTPTVNLIYYLLSLLSIFVSLNSKKISKYLPYFESESNDL